MDFVSQESGGRRGERGTWPRTSDFRELGARLAMLLSAAVQVLLAAAAGEFGAICLFSEIS